MKTTTLYDPDNKIWSGSKSGIEVNKYQSLGEMILEELSKNSDRVLQIDGDTNESWTVNEVRSRTLACIQNLTKLGCGVEQRITVIAKNHHNLTPLLYAAICIGSPVTPIDTIIDRDGVSHILQRVEPAFIFCDADVLLMVKQIIDDIGLTAKLYSVRGLVNGFDSIESLMKTTGDADSYVCAKIGDPFSHAAVIACSSGTTGQPKSICISHAMLIHICSSPNSRAPIRVLCFSSLYWISGILLTLFPVFGPCRVFTSKSFSPDLFFDLVEKYKVQYFLGPSSQMQAILKNDRCKSADLSSILVCNSVGGFVPSVLVNNLKELVPKCTFVTTYGLTEVGGTCTTTFPNELEEHPNSVGGLVPGIQMKIINENTHDKCGIGESGEIYVKASIPSMGYFRDEIANQKSFDKDGYLITGDIGYFDESGRLYISGRKKEIFKNRGYAIWPTELEDLIQKSQAVRYVSVVSVYDDEIMSDLPAAVVVKNEKHNITQDDIYALIADRLPSYKWLDGGIYFVDELPMTPTGKVVQSEAKQIAQTFYQPKRRNGQ